MYLQGINNFLCIIIIYVEGMMYLQGINNNRYLHNL